MTTLTMAKPLRSESVPETTRRLTLTRRFVETGDERCPLAGIWLRLEDVDTLLDEPDLPRPAMGALLAWRANPCTRVYKPMTALWYLAA